MPPVVVGSFLVLSSLHDSVEGILGIWKSPLSVSSSRNKGGDYLISRQVMSPTQQQDMLPIVETLDFPKKPTYDQLDDGTIAMLSKEQRPDDGMLHVGHWRDSVSMRKVKAS